MIDKIAWIEIENGKILVAKSKGKSVFYIPGGKRESNETDAQTLIREIREELSVELIPESLVHYGNFSAQAHGHVSGIIVEMTCYTASYRGTLLAANEIEEVAWLGFGDKDQVSFVDRIIFDDLKSKQLLK
ncbi:NUDIX hydrolase [Roseivirga echinicomitans]